MYAYTHIDKYLHTYIYIYKYKNKNTHHGYIFNEKKKIQSGKCI